MKKPLLPEQPKVEDFVDENGVRTTIEYSINDEGKKVKVRARIPAASARLCSEQPFCILSLRSPGKSRGYYRRQSLATLSPSARLGQSLARRRGTSLAQIVLLQPLERTYH